MQNYQDPFDQPLVQSSPTKQDQVAPPTTPVLNQDEAVSVTQDNDEATQQVRNIYDAAEQEQEAQETKQEQVSHRPHPEQAAVSTESNSESVPLIEVQKEHELEPEIEGWLEKLEQSHDVHLEKPVVHNDDVLVQSVKPDIDLHQDIVLLPLSEEQIEQASKQNITSSMRWLAVWCKRIIKIFKGDVGYQR